MSLLNWKLNGFKKILSITSRIKDKNPELAEKHSKMERTVKMIEKILDKYKVGNWWLATAFSAPTHGNTNWVNVVTSSGCIANFSCYKTFGVRPFCILRSDTVVSN